MKRVTGQQNIRECLPDLLYDESRFTCGTPREAVFAESGEEVAEILRDASAGCVPVTLVGAQTGITGGAVPSENSIAVCFSSMNRILRVAGADSSGCTIVCRPGITLADIDAFLLDPGGWREPVPGASQLRPGAYWYPPDPTEMTAHLGGTVATNASGARSYSLGPTRDFIRELDLVLASGERVRLARGTARAAGGSLVLHTDREREYVVPLPSYQSRRGKNACGYYIRPDMDAIDLFIGSEGTLGACIETTVRCVPRPVILSGLSFLPSRAAAFAFADFLRGRARIAAIEYFDRTALRFVEENRERHDHELPAFPAGMRTAVYWEYVESDAHPFENTMETWEERLGLLGSSLEATWSGFDETECRRLKEVRHALPELINAAVSERKKKYPSVRKIGTDSAFPAAAFPGAFEEYTRILEESGIPHVIFGHLGDFHLHCNMLARDDAMLHRAEALYDRMMDIAVARGGTVSAEHGIGKFKRRYLEKMYGPAAVEEMKRIKSVLDPGWILNRGTLFEGPR